MRGSIGGLRRFVDGLLVVLVVVVAVVVVVEVLACNKG
jgi:hypothetical protein